LDIAGVFVQKVTKRTVYWIFFKLKF